MIKFFRKIRHKLLSENKFSKYLIYAIGEIILVVIGILIALQINNWNEGKKKLQEEKEILSNLNNEFNQNYILLKRHDAQYQIVRECNKLLMSLIGKPKDEVVEHNIDSMLQLVIDVYDFRPTQNVISEIIASGKLNLISSDSLKNAIFSWTAGVETKEEAWETLDYNNQEMFLPYLIKNTSLKNIDRYGFLNWEEKSKLKSNNYEILYKLEFENNLDNQAWSIINYKNELGNLELIAKRIIKLTNTKK